MKVFILCFIILLNFNAIAQKNGDSTQTSNNPWHKIEFNIGGYLTDITTQARIGSEALGLGIGVDFEKALGLETTSHIYKLDALLRFGKKKNNHIELGYYSINRNSIKVLATDVELFDKIYKVGTRISSDTKVNIINLSYGHSFFQTANFDVGASFGFFVMPISLSLNVVDVNTVHIASSDALEFTAPLPVIGLYSNFAFTPKLIMRQSIDLFYIKWGTFKGTLAELNINLEYNIWKYFGLGLGFNSFNINFENQNPTYPEVDFRGQYGYKLTGLTYYIKGYF